MKKRSFHEGDLYHIFNKSISNYGIFKDLNNCRQFINTFGYYNNTVVGRSFSKFLLKNKDFTAENILIPGENTYVKCIAYCIMPDHYHFLLKILIDSSFSLFISKVENSFSRFFNVKFSRKGPLWQSEFKSVKIRTNEQLLHISRYIHLNPTTSNLVKKPEEWKYSSYNDYVCKNSLLTDILTEISTQNPEYYRTFVEDNIDYQKKLKMIKRLIFE